jgi:hypothetical protein
VIFLGNVYAQSLGVKNEECFGGAWSEDLKSWNLNVRFYKFLVVFLFRKKKSSIFINLEFYFVLVK